MARLTTLLASALAAAALALSGCTSAATNSGSTSTGRASVIPTTTPDKPATSPSPAPSMSPDLGTKEASGDVTLGAILVDPKLGALSAEVTITNHSSKRSNYIVDLSITDADGKTTLGASMVSAPGVKPGQTAKRTAQFGTTQKLPADATITIVGVARLVV